MLHFKGSQRIRHDLVTEHQQVKKTDVKSYIMSNSNYMTFCGKSKTRGTVKGQWLPRARGRGMVNRKHIGLSGP